MGGGGVAEDKQTPRKSSWRQEGKKLLPANLRSSERTVDSMLPRHAHGQGTVNCKYESTGFTVEKE